MLGLALRLRLRQFISRWEIVRIILGIFCLLPTVLLCAQQSAAAAPTPTPTPIPKIASTIRSHKVEPKAERSLSGKETDERSDHDCSSQSQSGMQPGDGASLE